MAHIVEMSGLLAVLFIIGGVFMLLFGTLTAGMEKFLERFKLPKPLALCFAVVTLVTSTIAVYALTFWALTDVAAGNVMVEDYFNAAVTALISFYVVYRFAGRNTRLFTSVIGGLMLVLGVISVTGALVSVWTLLAGLIIFAIVGLVVQYLYKTDPVVD